MKKIGLILITITLILLVIISGCGKKKQKGGNTLSKFELSQTSILGLPESEYNINILNYKDESINLEYEAKDWFELTYTNGVIKVKFLNEGKTSFDITKDNYEKSTINIECIDLKITNEDDHIECGSSQIINLSKDVSASFSVSNNSAYFNGNKLYVTEEDDFDVIVEYKGLVIKNHLNHIKELPK